MKKLDNKVAIITGGAMGNGLGIAKVFLLSYSFISAYPLTFRVVFSSIPLVFVVFCCDF